MRALLAAVALVSLQGCIYYVYVPPKGDKECDRYDWECEDDWDDGDWDDDDWDDDEGEFCEDLRERLGDCYEDRESRDECDELEELYEDYCLEDDWDDDDDDRGDDDDDDDDDDRGDDDDDDDDDRGDGDTAELQEGSWVMVLTGPDKEGDCDDVLLGGVDYLRLEADMIRLSDWEYLLETSYSQHLLFVEGDTFFGEGIIEFGGASAGSFLEGDILASDELQGYATGTAYGCQLTAELWGTVE